MAQTSSERRVDSVPLIPLSAGRFSLHLVLSSNETSEEDPFVRLSQDEDFSRVYLGVIKGDPDSVVDFCAVKLLRNAYRTAELLEEESVSNLAVERRWTFEEEQIQAFRDAGPFAPRLLQPDSDAQGHRLPPLLYCRTGQRFFETPCPRCGSGLATCRDDALLARAGLPLFGASLERFLYCSRCSAEDSESSPSFYAFEVTSKDSPGPALSASDLFRDLGEALAAGSGDGQVLTDFPCPDCLEAAKRFQVALGSGLRAAPFWENRWVPLTFYDSPYLVTGFGELPLLRVSEFLGGRSNDSLSEEMASSPGLPESARLRYAGEAELSANTGRLLFESDNAGMDAVEVLFLKLTAFRQTVEAVLEYMRVFGRPHLDLHPRHILFDLSRAGDGLPWLWGFRGRLHGLASAARPRRIADAVGVLVPSRNPTVPFAPPEVLEFHLAPPRAAQLVLTQLEDVDRRQGGGYRLHGKLTDPYGIYPTPRSHDWVVITLDNEALGLSNVTISSLPDPRAKPDEQELAFVSEPIALEDATAQKLKKTAGVRIPGSRYKVFTDYGSPSDLFSLGVILLTLLVGNDRQDAKAIAGEVERFSKGLAGSRDASDGPFEAAKALLEKDGEAARAFGKANIFFHELDRAETRPNAIPKELWARAVLLGLRLATRVAGFSVCSDRSDYDEVHPTAKLEATLQEASLLAAEVRSLLFQRQASHLEVQQVLSEVLAQQVPSPRAAR